MKATKLTVSGNYKTSGKEIVDFEDVTVTVPTPETDIAAMHLRTRYLLDAIAQDERYPIRPEKIRQMFVDEEQIVDAEFSFFGKDIKELDRAELQDLATYYDLRRIPASRGSGLRDARFVAYSQYSAVVLGKPLPKDVTPAEFAALPSLKIEEAKAKRAPAPVVLSLQDEIDMTKTTDGVLNLAQLKEIAKKRGVTHSPNIGFDALYAKLFDSESE